MEAELCKRKQEMPIKLIRMFVINIQHTQALSIDGCQRLEKFGIAMKYLKVRHLDPDPLLRFSIRMILNGSHQTNNSVSSDGRVAIASQRYSPTKLSVNLTSRMFSMFSMCNIPVMNFLANGRITHDPVSSNVQFMKWHTLTTLASANAGDHFTVHNTFLRGVS